MRDFRSDWYLKWKSRYAFPGTTHRKNWEIAIVSETLEAHGMLTPNRKGVGFGVGKESVVTSFADLGPRILATDLLPDDWRETHQGFGELAQHPNVETRIVDMNWIDGGSGNGRIDESTYDFTWSICSMDHCGTSWWTKRFLLNQMNCLRVGGIAVHTGEYTINVGMPREGATIWLDHRDVTDLEQLLHSLGHDAAPIDWFCGDSIEDHSIDCWPYTGDVHIKTEACGRWGTCICFAVRKKAPGVFWVPLDEYEAREAIASHQRFHSQT